MRSVIRAFPAVVAAISMTACGPGARPADASRDTAVTAPADAAVCIGSQPTNENYCSMPSCPFQPLSLPSCDMPGTNYSFYGSDLCQTSATLIVISAGWCVPCQREAPIIQRDITAAYAARGVRVISVYAQNVDAGTPTINECTAWRDRYRLTSHMVIDPAGLTARWTPMNAFPTNIIVDQNGIIYDVIYGSDLPRITDDLNAVLAAQNL